MTRKPKPPRERVANAGISLPPSLIDDARDYAKIEGFETLTNLVRYLLTQWMTQIKQKHELEDIAREHAKCAVLQPPRPKRGRPPKP
jgi:hypothetical protein